MYSTSFAHGYCNMVMTVHGKEPCCGRCI